jgi:hypothetical protein
MEDNPDVSLSLDDKRRAFDEYRAKWDAFHPIEKWEREIRSLHFDCDESGHGVYGFVAGSEESIGFLSLGLVSRGVPRKEWKLQLPDFEISHLVIDPHADVLVVVEQKTR